VTWGTDFAREVVENTQALIQHARKTQAMATTLIDWQSVRGKLASERKELFDCLLENPKDIHLAAAVRRLDDELLLCAEHMERDRKRAGKRI
jgi:hypothetical protein